MKLKTENLKLYPPIHFPEQHAADALEEEIWHPHPEVRQQGGIPLERLAKHDDSVVGRHQNQRHGDADVGLAAVRADGQRDADQREADARKRERHLLVELNLRWRGVFALLFQLGDARAQLAEAKLRGEPLDPQVARAALAGLTTQPGGQRMDMVVLACTHFPLVEAELAAAARRNNPAAVGTIPLEYVDDTIGFNPEWIVDKISPRPILFITSDNDRLVLPEESEQLYAHAGDPKKLVVLKGYGHYEVYSEPAFSEVMAATLEWYGVYL